MYFYIYQYPQGHYAFAISAHGMITYLLLVATAEEIGQLMGGN